MKLKLDLPKERWHFIKNKLEPHKNDSETITLFCHAIDSFDLEESLLTKKYFKFYQLVVRILFNSLKPEFYKIVMEVQVF